MSKKKPRPKPDVRQAIDPSDPADRAAVLHLAGMTVWTREELIRAIETIEAAAYRLDPDLYHRETVGVVRVLGALADAMRASEHLEALEKPARKVLRKTRPAESELTALDMRGRAEHSRAGEEIEAIAAESTWSPTTRAILISEIVARAFPDARGDVAQYEREHPIVNAAAWTQQLLRFLGVDAQRAYNAVRAKDVMRSGRARRSNKKTC